MKKKPKMHRYSIDIPKTLFNDLRFLSIIFNKKINIIVMEALTGYVDTPESKMQLKMSYKNIRTALERLNKESS